MPQETSAMLLKPGFLFFISCFFFSGNVSRYLPKQKGDKRRISLPQSCHLTHHMSSVGCSSSNNKVQEDGFHVNELDGDLILVACYHQPTKALSSPNHQQEISRFSSAQRNAYKTNKTNISRSLEINIPLINDHCWHRWGSGLRWPVFFRVWIDAHLIDHEDLYTVYSVNIL